MASLRNRAFEKAKAGIRLGVERHIDIPITGFDVSYDPSKDGLVVDVCITLNARTFVESTTLLTQPEQEVSRIVTEGMRDALIATFRDAIKRLDV